MLKKVTHDDLFKTTFSYPAEVEAFIRSFLPSYFSEHLDFSTLKQENTAFVSSELREYFADIVYSCSWENVEDKSGENIKITLLLEHKSYQPVNVYIQLLRYLTETYQHQYQSKQPLELVVPIVIYHGEKRWKSRPFESYFTLPNEELRAYLPDFSYELVDLSNWASELIISLQSGYFIKSTFLLFKSLRDKEAVKQLSQKIFIFAEEVELSREDKLYFLRQLMIYFFQTFEFKRDEFTELSQNFPAMTQAIAENTFDTLFNEGILKGKIEGKIEGEFLASIEEELKLLLKMLSESLDVSLMRRLTEVPEDFLHAVSEEYRPEKAHPLLKKLAISHTVSGLENITERIREALQEFGLSDEIVDNYIVSHLP